MKKPATVSVLKPADRRSIVKRLNFHLRLIEHVEKLVVDGDSDDNRKEFMVHAMAAERTLTNRMIQRLSA